MSRTDRACVFDIQRFSVHDGPGIRTVVFFKGCTLDCAWCHNPEALRRAPEITYWSERCLEGCSACVAACPELALRNEVMARVDWQRCTHCGLCVEPCPTEALVRVGRTVGVEELLEQVLRDRDFYESSGGGLTLSGGEPVLHSTFLQQFLVRVRAVGLHVVLETSGAMPWHLLEPLLGLVDDVYYDFKAAGMVRHCSFTGSDNRGILENLSLLLERSRGTGGSPAVQVRMPVVPGYNTDDAAVRGAADVLGPLGVRRLVLLPYNNLWEAKLHALDTRRPALGIAAPAPEFYEDMRLRFASHGIEAVVGQESG